MKTPRALAWALVLGWLALAGGFSAGVAGQDAPRPPNVPGERRPRPPAPPPPDPDAPPEPAPVPTPEAGALRLEVGWISREPRLPPPATIDAPIEEGWPAAGRAVHWVAHVLNRGDEVASGVPYAWTIDGEIALRGVADLVPGRTEILLPWTWRFARHQIGFAISPPRELGDATAADDQVAIASDALSLRLLVQRGLYDWLLQDGRPGFERLMQGEVDRWNALLARAVYPTSPEGALDRLRLDDVLIVPDDQRNVPSVEWIQADLTWRFRTVPSDTRFLHAGASPQVLADQTIVLHELLHQRGLIDLYDYRVIHRLDQPGDEGRVNIEENGRRIVGTFLMPPIGQGAIGMTVFNSPYNGLMGSQYRASARLTEHSAWGLNLWAGRRTPLRLDQWGNAINDLSGVVQPRSYVAQVPANTELSFVDQHGARIESAQVDVFLDHSRFSYVRTYRAGPDRTLAMDARGVAVLPGDALDRIAPRALGPPKAQVMVLGVRTPAARGFAFLPVHELNMRYFRGQRERAALQVPVTLHRW
jgi:hypothetical protein